MFTDDTQFCVSSFYLLDFCSTYRAENLRYHIKHGQNISPPFRQIVGLMCASRLFFFSSHVYEHRTTLCGVLLFARFLLCLSRRKFALSYQTWTKLHSAVSPNCRLDVRFALFFLFIACLRTTHNSVCRPFICSIFALLIAPKICASFFYLQNFFVVNFNAIFPIRQLFPLSPFPLKREPTATA